MRRRDYPPTAVCEICGVPGAPHVGARQIVSGSYKHGLRVEDEWQEIYWCDWCNNQLKAGITPVPPAPAISHRIKGQLDLLGIL